jgi:hypothetical protein
MDQKCKVHVPCVTLGDHIGIAGVAKGCTADVASISVPDVYAIGSEITVPVSSTQSVDENPLAKK